jgi:ubiquinol-cytochrome c reductase iron-sulfur subunit
VTGRTPTEPAGPSPSGEAFRPRWVVGWIAATIVGLVVLAVAWIAGAGVAVLGSIALLVAVAASIPLHHVVVTQDAGEVTADRPDTASADLPPSLPRRWLLGGGLAVLAAGLLALFGVRRFAPVRPEGSAWQAGSPLTTIDGRRLRPDDDPLGGVVTVWPEGAQGTERAAVMVVRLREPPEAPTDLDGVVDDTLVAYSRLCTHAGCAVALYRDIDQALFCPCHQATFDARRGARPTAGPASVALPQLPMALAADGYLVATGDLTFTPGPVGGQA